jgi:hypothetical protein
VGTDAAALQIVTRCGSAEEFIERFAPFTTETDIVVPALAGVSEGSVRSFVIFLEDGAVMMKGRCEVTAEPADATPPGEPARMRLRFREMDAHSAGIHLRLMELRTFSPEPAAAAMPEVVMSWRELTPTPAPLPAPSASDVAPIEIAVDNSAVTVVQNGTPSSDNETTAVSPMPSPETTDVTRARPRIRLDGERPARARQIGRRAAPYAAGLIVGLLLGIAIRPGSKGAPVAVAPKIAPAPVAAAAPVAAPAPAAAPAPSATEEEPTDDPIPPSRRAAGGERELAKVVVTSSPARAFIKVNKHRLGRTPREISARRFERVRIEASLPGYQRWKKTIYLEDAEVKLDVKLVRKGEADARRGTPPSGPPARATAQSSVGVPGAVAAR